MADLGGTFDPNEVPERAGDFPLLAEKTGVQMQVVSSMIKMKDVVGNEVSDMSDCEKASLGIEFETAPDSQHFMIWLNIRHPNEQTQSIAHRELADLFNATGTCPSSNSDDLHFKPFIGDIRIHKDKKGEWPDKNVIRKYRPLAGAAPPAQKAQTTAARPAARPATVTSGAGGGAAKGSAPWRRPAGAQTQARTPPFDEDIPF